MDYMESHCPNINTFMFLTVQCLRVQQEKEHKLLYSINKILIPGSVAVKQPKFFTKYFKIPAKPLTFILEETARQKTKQQFFFQEFSLDCLSESHLTFRFPFLFQGRQLQLCSIENFNKRYEDFLLPWKKCIGKHKMEKLTFFCDLCPNV